MPNKLPVIPTYEEAMATAKAYDHTEPKEQPKVSLNATYEYLVSEKSNTDVSKIYATFDRLDLDP